MSPRHRVSKRSDFALWNRIPLFHKSGLKLLNAIGSGERSLTHLFFKVFKYSIRFVLGKPADPFIVVNQCGDNLSFKHYQALTRNLPQWRAILPLQSSNNPSCMVISSIRAWTMIPHHNWLPLKRLCIWSKLSPPASHLIHLIAINQTSIYL